jgi:ABC-type glutathione transport system ATPase component
VAAAAVLATSKNGTMPFGHEIIGASPLMDARFIGQICQRVVAQDPPGPVDQIVIDRLSLDVRRGEILDQVGASGGGKSALMRAYSIQGSLIEQRRRPSASRSRYRRLRRRRAQIPPCVPDWLSVLRRSP